MTQDRWKEQVSKLFGPSLCTQYLINYIDISMLQTDRTKHHFRQPPCTCQTWLLININNNFFFSGKVKGGRVKNHVSQSVQLVQSPKWSLSPPIPWMIGTMIPSYYQLRAELSNNQHTLEPPTPSQPKKKKDSKAHEQESYKTINNRKVNKKLGK